LLWLRSWPFQARQWQSSADHTGEPGVIECGKKNNVFLSEDRFLDNNPGFSIPVVPVFATDFDELGCWEWSWVFERWEWEDDCN
jgi:hypothetical protein